MPALLTTLTERDLADIASLERRVVDRDGGRLKLEWGNLRNRNGDSPEDVVWREDDRLVGFAGVYAYGGATPEVTGMVDPAYRRRGIASALLGQARDVVAARGAHQLLLVTPRHDDDGVGAEFAQVHGGVHEHSEHVMLLAATPVVGTPDPRVTLRPAVEADLQRLSEILSAAFGHVGEVHDLEATTVIAYDGQTVGTLRVSGTDPYASIYGFAVDPDRQGRGIGREALGRVCRELREQGHDRVGLEVAVDNDQALGLYLRVGFERILTEDYFAVPTNPKSATPLA